MCNSEIPRGQKYCVSTVSKHKAHLFRSIMANVSPDPIPTATEDAEGNIRLDICLDCYMHMGISGGEVVS